MSTGALASSSLFVLVSALVVPAWRNKHRASEHANAVQMLSVLTLGAAVIATAWLTLQVVSLGVHDTAPQSNGHGSSLGSVFGIPMIVIPLAILLAFVGVAELLVRAERSTPSIPFAQAMAASTPSEPPAGSGRLRQGRDERALASIHDELAEGGIRSREVLADALAQIESWWTADLDERSRVEASTHAAVEVLQESVADSTSDVTRAMQSVAEACEVVNARIEAHRLERHALADAIMLLARPVEAPIEARGRAVSAEVVIPDASMHDSGADTEISIVEPDTEISIIEDDPESPLDDEEPVEVGRPSAPSYGTRRAYANQGSGALLTSVKRLRERAQSAGWQVWTRARPRPGRNGEPF